MAGGTCLLCLNGSYAPGYITFNFSMQSHALMHRSTDIGDFVRSGGDVTDHDKYQLTVNLFAPAPSYNFQQTTGGRSFQYSWLVKYPWLRYSEQDNGGYCLPCVLFARSTNLRSDPGMLVKNPLPNFQKALEFLNKHAEKSYHKAAVVQMDAFLKVMTNQHKHSKAIE